jgi:hypothetical protein
MDFKLQLSDQFKMEDFANKLSKLSQGSMVNYFKFYNRNTPVYVFLILGI